MTTMRAVAGSLVLAVLAGCGPEELWDEETGDGSELATSEAPLTEGAPMTGYNASCLQLRDLNTWSAALTNIAPVGPATTLASILTDLNRSGPVLTSTTHPAATGYRSGFKWQSGDVSVAEWIPQGFTAGTSGDKNVAIASWYHAPPTGTPGKGVRISIADTTTFSGASIHYRLVLLVQPTAPGVYVPVKEHAGGLAWIGHYLYMADTSDGMRVFDLNQIRRVNDTAACANAIGKTSAGFCAYGYRYVLPQVSVYDVPDKKADGTLIPTDCKPKFSWLGKDTRASQDYVLSGEYCNATNAPCKKDGSTPGMGARMYLWPLDSTGKLVTANGWVTPKRAFFVNERNVQGVAPVMVKRSDGTYPPNAYWFSATANYGQLTKKSTSTSRRVFLWKNGQTVYAPEGMHASASGSNLWIVTEGRPGVTDPRYGGRVVVFVRQSDID